MLMYCDHHSSVKLNEIIMNSVICFIHHIGEFHKRNLTRNVYSRNPVHKYNRHITWTMENFGLMMTEIQQRNFQLQENGVLPLMEFIFALNILCNMLLFTEAWNHVLVQWRSVWCVVPASYIARHDLQLKYQIPTPSTEAYKYSFYPRSIRIWNDLPPSVVLIPDTAAFKEAPLPIIRGMLPPPGSNLLLVIPWDVYSAPSTVPIPRVFFNTMSAI